MITHRLGPDQWLLALALAIWAPWSCAETIYGPWNGDVSGFAEMTKGRRFCLTSRSIRRVPLIHRRSPQSDAAGDGAL